MVLEPIQYGAYFNRAAAYDVIIPEDTAPVVSDKPEHLYGWTDFSNIYYPWFNSSIATPVYTKSMNIKPNDEVYEYDTASGFYLAGSILSLVENGFLDDYTGDVPHLKCPIPQKAYGWSPESSSYDSNIYFTTKEIPDNNDVIYTLYFVDAYTISFREDGRVSSCDPEGSWIEDTDSNRYTRAKRYDSDGYHDSNNPRNVYTDSTTLTTGITLYDNAGTDTGLVVSTLNSSLVVNDGEINKYSDNIVKTQAAYSPTVYLPTLNTYGVLDTSINYLGVWQNNTWTTKSFQMNKSLVYYNGVYYGTRKSKTGLITSTDLSSITAVDGSPAFLLVTGFKDILYGYTSTNVYSSTDGTTWTDIGTYSSVVKFTNGALINYKNMLIGYTGSSDSYVYSLDGLTFTQITSPINANSIIVLNDTLLMLDNLDRTDEVETDTYTILHTTYTTSIDGITWTEPKTIEIHEPITPTSASTKLVAFHNGTNVFLRAGGSSTEAIFYQGTFGHDGTFEVGMHEINFVLDKTYISDITLDGVTHTSDFSVKLSEGDHSLIMNGNYITVNISSNQGTGTTVINTMSESDPYTCILNVSSAGLVTLTSSDYDFGTCPITLTVYGSMTSGGGSN